MTKNNRSRGQALLMVTMSSIALFAMIGLASDLSWDYFVKRKTQAAADAAALAAVRSVYDSVGAGKITCGTNAVCQDPTTCPTSINNPPLNGIDAACLYAKQNGYTSAGNQKVTVAAGTTSPYTTATGTVAVRYWVSVVVAETVPQLWSAIRGQPYATTISRATGAVGVTTFDGNLILLDRDNDAAGFGSNGSYVYGQDIEVQAHDNQSMYAVQAYGIVMSSSCNGTSLGNANCTTGNKAAYAGTNQGGGTVYSPYTTVRTGGGVSMGGSSKWIQPPSNSAASRFFNDPMAGMGQPAAPAGLPDVPVPGGVIDGTQNPVTLTPGNYYAANSSGSAATGDPIIVKGTVRFSACSGCAANAAFGKYVIFGGMVSSGAGANVTFDPGQYVFAGAKWSGGTNTGHLLDTSTNFNITDSGSSVGEILVFTDLNYPGLQVPGAVSAISSQLPAGQVNFSSGNNGTTISLHGLNSDSTLVQSANLDKFGNVLLWQDQANSTVKYTSQGNVDTSCGTLTSPCARSLTNSTSPQLSLQASPTISLNGVIYQPRGAWTTIVSGSGYKGPLQLVTGAVQVKANSILNLQPPPKPITFVGPGLIE